MSIAAALILLGACGSASRTMTVDASIEQIVLRVVAGGVKDVFQSRTERSGHAGVFGVVEAELPTLRIDGRERTGVLAWAAAAYRVAGYCIDRRTDNGDAAGVGSVEYSYRLRVRGFDIRRSTRISDGRVSLLTDVYGSIADGRLHHVRLVLDAREMGNGTRIRGTSTGWSRIGDRCRLVGRIASRVIGDELDAKLLGRVQAGGIDLYRAGAVVEVLR